MFISRKSRIHVSHKAVRRRMAEEQCKGGRARVRLLAALFGHVVRRHLAQERLVVGIGGITMVWRDRICWPCMARVLIAANSF